MAETREQSYYEIALTNRQVLSIFVVLLVSLLVAFASGVWIGREDDGAGVQVASAERITAAHAAGEKPLAEMNFFSGEMEQAAASTVSPAPVLEEKSNPELVAVVEPVEVEAVEAVEAEPAAELSDVSRSAEDPAPAAADPTELRKLLASAEAPAMSEIEGIPVDESVVGTPGPSADTTASAAASGFFVQVFSSNDENQAGSLAERLRSGGYGAFLSPADVSGRTVYRVRIGPYIERDEAEQVAESVQQSFKLNTWITR